MKKRILLTGGCGFIGFHTALALKKRGDEVLVIDNFNSYYTPVLKRKREEILKECHISIMEGDITDASLLKDLFHTFGPTHVLNLAAQAGVRYARENPHAYLKSNVEGFLVLLETLRLFPQTKLVYASSSSVYGCNDTTPFSLSDLTDRPANFYAVTKKTNELMAYAYNHLYGIKTIGLRYFTVYGPWGRPDMAYFSFAEAIWQEKPITLFCEGNMQRDFTYIDDVVEATVSALDIEEGKAVYNIGNHRPEQLMHLVNLLEEGLQKKAKIVWGGEAKGEVATTFADIKEAKSDLNFNPKTSLDKGIASFLAWYKSHYLLNSFR